MTTLSRITKVFNLSDEVYFDDNSKIIIMSDLHRGDGNWNDSFAKNQNVFLQPYPIIISKITRILSLEMEMSFGKHRK